MFGGHDRTRFFFLFLVLLFVFFISSQRPTPAKVFFFLHSFSLFSLFWGEKTAQFTDIAIRTSKKLYGVHSHHFRTDGPFFSVRKSIENTLWEERREIGVVRVCVCLCVVL